MRDDEWLWGWDPTPGIVSVWADADGRAVIWRRIEGELIREEARFRPWMLLDQIDDLNPSISCQELDGPGALRYLVSSHNWKTPTSAVLEAASRRIGRRIAHVLELGEADAVLALPPEEAVSRLHRAGPISAISPSISSAACSSIWKPQASTRSATASS